MTASRPNGSCLLWLSIAAMGFLACPQVRASIAYGSINNFDTVNDTGQPCHGFEIEIEDCRSTDITYTYNYNHYGVPSITQDDSVANHPKCLIRWASKKNPDGSWASFTAVPSGPIAPTDGHMFTNPAVNFGGEHFGVGYRVAVGAIGYHWLVDNGSGVLVRGGAVQVSTPSFTYYPPVAGNAAPAQVQAVIQPPAPPEIPVKEFGQAVWVKEIRTTSHNPNGIALRNLVSDDPDQVDEKNWANGEPDEVEVEWQLLQTEFNKAGGGARGELQAAPEDLNQGDEVVTRRYEFFEYAGPLDEETGEAMADVVGADGIHGEGVKEVNGAPMDLATVVVVGEFKGSQMAAVDVDAPVGLIDHVGEGMAHAAYAGRTVIIQGALPFTATREGALPAGMTFSTVTGVLSGTPSESGDFAFKITASDGVNPEVAKTYTLRIAPADAALPPASLLDTAVEPVGAGITTGDGFYAVGDSATATAAAAEGYVFLNWTDNGELVSTGSTVNQVMDVNHSLVANFMAAGVSCTISASADPAAGGQIRGAGVVAEGEIVNLVATPQAGYAFVDWREGGNLVSQDASYTFTASADRVLVAHFVLSGGSPRTVAVSASPAAGGTVTGGGTYENGASVTLEAMAQPGYKFSKWKEGGSTVSTSASYTFTITANRSLVASFEPVFTVTASASPPAGGTTEADSQSYKAGDAAQVKAFPAAGYEFSRWSEDGVTVSTDIQYDFTVNRSHVLVAHFTPAGGVAVSTSASPEMGGTTHGGGNFLAGDLVTVTAAAAPGYGFLGWTEGGAPVSASAAYSFTASANRALVARFAPGFTIGTAVSPAGGAGTASGGGFVLAGGSATLTATASPGYVFVNWTDAQGSEASASPSFTFTPAADEVFTAHFAMLPAEFIFDFDTGTPVLAEGQGMPFEQTTGGFTITCSSPQTGDCGITSETASGQALSQFSGRYLASLADGAVLVIQFAQPVTGVSLDFATVEAADVPVAADLRLTAVDTSSGVAFDAGTGIAHGAVGTGDTLPAGTLNFNSASGSFDEIRLQMHDASSASIRFLVDNLVVSPASSTGGTILLENPNWNVTLTDYGYSDFLLDNTPGFEGREYLSGEWASAVAYTRGGQSYAPVWLEPDFVFPDWHTNSNFRVVSGIRLAGTNLDGLPVAESIIANNDLQITLRFEMADTVTGTPMGLAPASGSSAGKSVNSNRYVLRQSFVVKNVSGEHLTGVQLFQFLHGLNSQRGQFDNRSYPGKLADYQYDVTMAGVDAGAAGAQSSDAGVEDLIGFHAKVPPSAFEVGAYGIADGGIDDHSLGKPSDGVHLSIENNWQSAPCLDRKNRDSFAPASPWVGGAQRWELGDLAPGQSATFDLVLSLLTGTKVVITGGSGGTGSGAGGSCNGGSGVVGGVDFEFEDLDQEGSFFGEFAEADEDEMLERENDGEFTLPSFETPAGARRQTWNLRYSGSHSGKIRLRFAYDPSLLPPNYDQNQLAIYHFSNGAWVKLPGSVDPVNHVISAETPSLSPFMLGVNDVVVRPQVELSASSPGMFNVQWPDSFTGWTLQESADLATWVNSSRVVSHDQGVSSVPVPVASGARFFRLLRP